MVKNNYNSSNNYSGYKQKIESHDLINILTDSEPQSNTNNQSRQIINS